MRLGDLETDMTELCICRLASEGGTAVDGCVAASLNLALAFPFLPRANGNVNSESKSEQFIFKTCAKKGL